MATHILNIGLNRNDGKPANTREFTINTYQKAMLGKTIEKAKVEQSNTEQTLILYVSSLPDDYMARLDALCKEIAQDCVACANISGKAGILIGPKAEKWGPFNPNYFLR